MRVDVIGLPPSGAKVLVTMLIAGPMVALAATYLFSATLDKGGDGRWGRRERLFVACLVGFWALGFWLGAGPMTAGLMGVMYWARLVLPLALLAVGLAATYLFGYLFGGEDEVSGWRRAVMLLGAVVVFASVGMVFGTRGLGIGVIVVFMAAVLIGSRTPPLPEVLEEEEGEEG